MSARTALVFVAAAALTSAALIIPATGASAQRGWHSVTHNNQPLVTGSGRIVRQNRAVGNFRGVELMGFSDAVIQLGAKPSLTIEADDNLLPYFTSNVERGVLRIDTRGSLRTRRTPRIFITVPNLESVTTSGSGDVAVNGVNNQRLTLVTRGSGNIRATGRTGNLTATVQGSGNADVRGLAAGRAQVAVHGSGNAWVATSGAVSASSFGSGNVYVLGRPSSLQVSEAGSGRVIARVR